jgi:hypothetical protein
MGRATSRDASERAPRFRNTTTPLEGEARPVRSLFAIEPGEANREERLAGSWEGGAAPRNAPRIVSTTPSVFARTSLFQNRITQ